MTTNNYLSILTILSFFFSSSPLWCQAIQKIGNNNFEYQEQTYKYKDMGLVFSHNELANLHFKEAMKKRKESKRLGVIALAGIGVGGISHMVSGEGMEDCQPSIFFGLPACSREPTTLQRTGTFMITTGAVIGIFALVKWSKIKKSKKASLESFNKEYGINLPQKNQINVQLVMSNGLGIQLKF